MLTNAAVVCFIAGGATGSGDDQPFYALGVNIARQVGGELKPLVSAEELATLINGFSDSLLNRTVDEEALLTTHGPKLNAIITERREMAMDAEKNRGKSFISKFLLSHPNAVQSPSGLVYKEIIAGIGKKVGCWRVFSYAFQTRASLSRFEVRGCFLC